MATYLTVKELKPKDREQLKTLLAGKQEQLRRMRFQISSKEVKNHRTLRYLRREIARIHTVMSEKKHHPEVDIKSGV